MEEINWKERALDAEAKIMGFREVLRDHFENNIKLRIGQPIGLGTQKSQQNEWWGNYVSSSVHPILLEFDDYFGIKTAREGKI